MLWARFHRAFSAYFIDRGGVLDFFHSQLKEAVELFKKGKQTAEVASSARELGMLLKERGEHADAAWRQLLRHRLAQADLGRLHRVVGHAATGLAPEDRRDVDDHAGAEEADAGDDLRRDPRRVGARSGAAEAVRADDREQRSTE